MGSHGNVRFGERPHSYISNRYGREIEQKSQKTIWPWPLTSIIIKIKRGNIRNISVKGHIFIHKKQKWWQKDKYANMTMWPWPLTFKPILTVIMWDTMKAVCAKFRLNSIEYSTFQRPNLKNPVSMGHCELVFGLIYSISFQICVLYQCRSVPKWEECMQAEYDK